MNGSRSNPPRPGVQPYGDRTTSLDALNRTIEGLEARIEGLMGGVARDPRNRPPVEREIVQPRPDPARPDPVSEILQRQRSLSAGRERETLRERVAARQEPHSYERSVEAPLTRDVQPVSIRNDQPLRDVFRTEPSRQPLREAPVRQEAPLRQPVRQEPMRAEPARHDQTRYEQPRREELRQEHPRQETLRQEVSRPEPVRQEPPRPDPAMAEIAQALVGLRQELKKDISDGLAREMGVLRDEIRGITADAGQDQRLAEDMRGDLQRLADSIAQLGRQASPSPTDTLRVEFDEMRAMIDGLAREDSVRRMESRWTGVEDRLHVFDASRDDELVALAYRLDEIKSQIGTLNSTPAIHALEDKLVSVAQAIELLGRHMQPDDQRFTSQFADLDTRLDEISRAIVASGRTSATADSASVNRVEGRLADLSRQMEVLSQPNDNGLGARIEALTARVEELANEEAAVRLEERLGQLSAMMERSQKTAPQPDLTAYLTDISHKIDALDQGAVNEALAERLDDLARRIDALDAPADTSAGDARFDRLEGQLSDIAQRLEDTQAVPYDDGDMLRSLQAQIANLSNLVSSQSHETAVAAMPAEFEGRMNALEDYLATSDEYIIEAARQAAEAVMEAYSKNGAPVNASGGTDFAAISALADDLKVLEDLSRSSEERTARTFEALHETLIHIAEKLEKLEERGSQPAPHAYQPSEPAYLEEEEAAPVFGKREFRDARPMPRAQQPVFAQDSDRFDDVDFDNRYEDLKRDMQALSEEAAQQSAPSQTDMDMVQAGGAAETGYADTPIEPQIVAAPQAPVARKSLLAGLTKRFTGKRKEPEGVAVRQNVDPTPSIDPVDAIAPDVANQLLEPGSGVPDVKKILERVRAGQSARGAQSASSESEKADFIAAARRAAQLAVEEVDTIHRGADRSKPAASGSSIARHRRPILIAVGAVLLAIMSYPLVNTLIRGDDAPVAPVAAIEQSVTQAQPVTEAQPQTQDVIEGQTTAPAADATVAPLSSLQPQAADGDDTAMVPAESAAQLPAAEPDADAQPADTQTTATPADAATAEPAQATTGMMEPVESDAKAETGSDASKAPFAKAETFTPLTKAQEPIAVPAEIAPAALADAAKGGDPLALFEIGSLYTEGRGVKADLAEAAKWYQRAADAGLVPAEYRLANLYEKGTGVGRDIAKAKTLYEDAASKGNASAMHNLAVLLASGNDAVPDFANAGKWFNKAADLGVRDSQFNLAILYARGNGVKQDLEESYKWFAVAARDGDADAAQKRDEVAKALQPDQLKSAKAKFDTWKVIPTDAKANDVAVPDTWVGKGTKTASIDMKKAVRNIQAILNNNGFDAGKPDGELGQKTVGAIRNFQKSIGQEPTGQITDALVKELLKRN